MSISALVLLGEELEVKNEKNDISQKPTALTYFKSGNAKTKNSDYKGAITDYTKAIGLNPKYKAAYINRALARDKIHDYRGAVNDYNKSIELDNKILSVQQRTEIIYIYMNRGNVRKYMKDYEGSISDYTKVVDLDNQYYPALLARAEVKTILQNYNGALIDYDKAVSINSNMPAEIYFEMGNIKYALKKYEDAVYDYQKAILYSSDYDKAYYKLLELLITTEKFNEALTVLQKYISTAEKPHIYIKDLQLWNAHLNKYKENDIIRNIKTNLKNLKILA